MSKVSLKTMGSCVNDCLKAAQVANDKLLKTSIAKWLFENREELGKLAGADDESAHTKICSIINTSVFEFAGASTHRTKKVKKSKKVVRPVVAKVEVIAEKPVKRPGRPRRERTEKELAEEKAKADRKQKREKKKARKAANADKPKRIPCGYMLWLNAFRDEIKSHLEDKSVTNVTKTASLLWKEMTDAGRAGWTQYREDLMALRDGNTTSAIMPKYQLNIYQHAVIDATPLVDYESDEE